MAYIGNQPVPQATQTRDRFVATSAQTSFATNGYTPGFLDVYLNGVHLDATDYTATNGSDVVLASGAASGDIVEVVAYSAFEAANTLPAQTGNTGKYLTTDGSTASWGTVDLSSKVSKTGDTMTGNLVLENALGWFKKADGSLIADGRNTGVDGRGKLSLYSGRTDGGWNGFSLEYQYHASNQAIECVEFVDGGSVSRWKLDRAGRVTTPYQPMFYAQHNSASSSSGNYGHFDNEFVNVGGHASHGTHGGSYTYTRWYAPVTGKYLVWVGNIGPNASTTQRTRVVKNGTTVSSELRTHQDANHGTSASMMVLVSAAAGDWIGALSQADDGSLGFYSGTYSHFGVQLIG